MGRRTQHPTARRRPLLAAGGLGLVAALLAACAGSGGGLNVDALKQQVRRQVQSDPRVVLTGGLVADVTCPDQRPLQRGDRFTCTATVVGIANRPTNSDLTAVTVTSPSVVEVTVTVTQLDRRGTVRIETGRLGGG